MMTSTEATRCLCMRPVKRAAYPIRQGRVICILYEVERKVKGEHSFCLGYALELSGSCGHSLHMLGHHALRAHRIFDLMVRNTVTPCTVDDILQDLAMEEENR